MTQFLTTILILYFSWGGVLAMLERYAREEIFMITCGHAGNFISVWESLKN